MFHSIQESFSLVAFVVVLRDFDDVDSLLTDWKLVGFFIIYIPPVGTLLVHTCH